MPDTGPQCQQTRQKPQPSTGPADRRKEDQARRREAQKSSQRKPRRQRPDDPGKPVSNHQTTRHQQQREVSIVGPLPEPAGNQPEQPGMDGQNCQSGGDPAAQETLTQSLIGLPIHDLISVRIQPAVIIRDGRCGNSHQAASVQVFFAVSVQPAVTTRVASCRGLFRHNTGKHSTRGRILHGDSPDWQAEVPNRPWTQREVRGLRGDCRIRRRNLQQNPTGPDNPSLRISSRSKGCPLVCCVCGNRQFRPRPKCPPAASTPARVQPSDRKTSEYWTVRSCNCLSE
jgi:hypothetical protein